MLPIADLYSVITQIAVGLFVAVVYGLLLSERMDAIRAAIARSQRGWFHRRYVQVFIQAVRGEAAVADTRTLMQLFLLYPIILLVVGWILYFAEQNMANRMDELMAQIESDSTIEVIAEDASENDKNEVRQTRQGLEFLYPKIIAFLVLGHVWFWWVVLIRQPYALFRSRFAHELNRFLFRIQGLASKSELAVLTRLEARVRDEPTAHEFVNQVALLARRHDVDHLVETFLLWGQPAIEEPSGTPPEPT